VLKAPTSGFSATRANWTGQKVERVGDMFQRWAAAALLRAERKFKRVKGYREIRKLTAALQQKSIDRKEVAA